MNPIILTEEELPYVRRYIAERCTRNGPCIEWVGARNAGGRGIAYLPRRGADARRRRMYAYRLVWTVYQGPIPQGMNLCHKCDNPLCVKISHLFVGTQAANVADMIDKGRGVGRAYSVKFQKAVIDMWASGAWGSRRQLATHLGMPHETLIKWLNRDMPSRPQVRDHRESLTSLAPVTFLNPIHGELSPKAKLTDVQVADIVARFSQPGGPRTPSNARELAAEFGITPQYVAQLARRQWRKRRTGLPVPEHLCRLEVAG